MRNLPLDGVTIVSIEQAIAAPFATRQLADLGARVIKVERPHTGDFARSYDTTVNGLSSHFVWVNRSKESLALDLKDPDQLAALRQLIARADVFVQNLAPGAAARLGLGAEELRASHPGLITCSISGYGATGPYRDAKAYDLLIQAEAGLVSITGSEDSPAKTGIPSADISAGMYAFSGILTALYQRERTGEGADLNISLFDSLVEWMGYPLNYSRYGGSDPARAGTSHPAIAPYGAFRSGDGDEIIIAIQNEREWKSLCDNVLGDSNIADDPRFSTGSARVAHRGDVDALVQRGLSRHSTAEAEQALSDAGIAFARRRELADVVTHPQLTTRGRWVNIETPAGTVEATLPPINIDGVSPRMGAVPDLGEHSEAILAELSPVEASR